MENGPIAPFDVTGPSFTGDLLAIPLSAPPLGFQRKPGRPRRQTAHQIAQLLDGTESLWNFGYELVVYMQDDRIAVRLDVEDCVREQITGYSLRQILGQLPAVQFIWITFVVEVPDFLPLASVDHHGYDFWRSVTESSS